MKEKTNKRAIAYSTAIGLFLGAAALAFAISSLWTNESFIINNTKGHTFSADLSGQVSGIAAVPGSEQSVSPTMTNTGTEEMYVFIRFDVGTYSSSTSELPIYSFVVDTESHEGAGAAWTAVATDNPAELLFAYGSESELLPVQPGAEVTLPGKLVATSDNTVFSGLSNSDMKVKVTGCAIGTDNESAVPSEAYADYVSLGGE